VRQVGSDVWWLGMSADNGKSWTNVYKGSLNAPAKTVDGLWSDVPKGGARSSGTLNLTISQNPDSRIINPPTSDGRVWRSRMGIRLHRRNSQPGTVV
jgi:hypothetical protein